MDDLVKELGRGSVWKICSQCHNGEPATRDEVAFIRDLVRDTDAHDHIPSEAAVTMTDCGGFPYLMLAPSDYNEQQVLQAAHTGDERCWLFLEPVFSE